jgi:hypothetical protein
LDESEGVSAAGLAADGFATRSSAETDALAIEAALARDGLSQTELMRKPCVACHVDPAPASFRLCIGKTSAKAFSLAFDER